MNLKVCKCTNSRCNKPIYKGDEVWRGGGMIYCSILCFLNRGGTHVH